MSQGGLSEPLLLLALFTKSSPSPIKVMGGVVVGGRPCDFSVSPWSKSSFFSFFGGLLFDFGACWDQDLDQGLTIASNLELLASGRNWAFFLGHPVLSISLTSFDQVLFDNKIF